MREAIGDKAGLSSLLKDYLSEFGKQGVSWLDVAASYTFLGRFDKAEEMFRLYRDNNPDYQNAAEYYSRLYHFYESSGDYEEAFGALYRGYIISMNRPAIMKKPSAPCIGILGFRIR